MKEEKGCYFCNAFKYSKYGEETEPLNGRETRLSLKLEPFYGEQLLLNLGGEFIDRFDIKFCPMCGRKLGE